MYKLLLPILLFAYSLAITTAGKQIGYLIPVNGDLKIPTLTGIPMDDIIILCESDSRHMLF